MANPFSLDYMQRRFSVVRIRETNTYSVQLMFCPGSDEMWESMTHAAGFPTEARAQAFAERISQKGRLDLDHWIWYASVCTPFSDLQQRPVARHYVVKDKA